MDVLKKEAYLPHTLAHNLGAWQLCSLEDIMKCTVMMEALGRFFCVKSFGKGVRLSCHCRSKDGGLGCRAFPTATSVKKLAPTLSHIIDRGCLRWYCLITHRVIVKNAESMAGRTATPSHPRDNAIPITSADSVTKVEAGDELSQIENQKLVSNCPPL